VILSSNLGCVFGVLWVVFVFEFNYLAWLNSARPPCRHLF